MHKIINGYAPKYLSGSFQTNDARHSHKLRLPRPNITLFKSCLCYSGGMLWNNLPVSLKRTCNSNAFKKKLRDYLFEISSSNLLPTMYAHS